MITPKKSDRDPDDLSNLALLAYGMCAVAVVLLVALGIAEFYPSP